MRGCEADPARRLIPLPAREGPGERNAERQSVTFDCIASIERWVLSERRFTLTVPSH